MNGEPCASGCNRVSRLFSKHCRLCLEGKVPEPEPKLCSDRYLTACALELIRRGALQPVIAEEVQRAVQERSNR